MKKQNRTKHKKIAESILDYWHTIEFLTQDTLPGLTREELQKNRRAINRAASSNNLRAEAVTREVPAFLKLLIPLNQGGDLLEVIQSETKKHGMACWGNITIYAGKNRRETCIQRIASMLGEEDTRPEKNKDEIAWFSLQLTPDGTYVEKTFAFSTILWAISQMKDQPDCCLSGYLSEQSYREEMEHFDHYFASIGKTLEHLVGASEEAEAALVTWKHIDHIYQDIKKNKINEMLEADSSEFFCLLSFQIYKDKEARDRLGDEDYTGLGKTFFADDIKLVLTKIQENGKDISSPMEEALIQYITGAYAEFYPEKEESPFQHRIDLGNAGKTCSETFSAILDVQNAPIGKWPSRFMPALMQQTAVNLAAGLDSGNEIMFSVNGPPGTGKTTLLKEVIVHHVVQKATLLAEYEKPDDAFSACSFTYGTKKNHGYSDWFSKYYKLKNDAINDYSILVASCNNAAVENITKELPLESGITGALTADKRDSQKMTEQLSELCHLFTVENSQYEEELYTTDNEKRGRYKDIYFTEYARGLLEKEDAWGLISAALGKKSNIHRFYQKVLRPLISDFYVNDKLISRLESFRHAKKEFLKQKETVQKMQRELAIYCGEERKFQSLCREGDSKILSLQKDNEQIWLWIKENDRQIDEYTERINDCNESLEQTRIRLEETRGKIENIKMELEDTDRKYTKKLKDTIEVRSSIHFMGKLFRSNDAKVKEELAEKYTLEAQEIKDGAKQRMEQYKTAFAQLEKEEQEESQLQKELKNLEQEKNQRIRSGKVKQDHILENQNEMESLEKAIQKSLRVSKNRKKEHDMKEDFNQFTALDENFMNRLFGENEEESTAAHVSNPWFTNVYNREREKLFYYALRLEKEFVLSSKRCLQNYKNLALLWKETKEENETVSYHKEDKEACFAPLLQSLFLLVPVISTTFASVGSFLKDIKEPSAIGTVIVDEAGQAPPQMAVGAFYRSRKAIVVGDPKQVEPVVTDDLSLLKQAYKEDIYQPYKSKQISVQQFTDRMNLVGTYMESERNEMEWLGCPLVVHRRCISPMYEISNEISYHNTMKQQTKLPSEKKKVMFCYTGSRWINVKGSEIGNKNHFVEEQGERVLQILELAFSKSDNPSLFIITPFTTVKMGMLRHLENHIKKYSTTLLQQKQNRVKEWMYSNIGTVHTFQGKEADEVIFLLGCDAKKEAAGAIRWVNSNLVNVAVTRAKYRLYVIGDEQAWKESIYISQTKRMIDLHALSELSGIVSPDHGEEDPAISQERIQELCDQLPTAESFSVEKVDQEEGQVDYFFDSVLYLDELKGGELLLQELTEEQLKGYGFTKESLQSLHPQVREYLEWGIKIYSMMKKLINRYDINNFDVSCCGILFCKAAELQVQECFYDGLKKQFPDYIVKSFKTNKISLKTAEKMDMTLGTFQNILHREEHKLRLTNAMRTIQNGRYEKSWWDKFDNHLYQCKNLRNLCCHCDRFSWKQMNDLLVLLFLQDKEMKPMVNDGLIRDSEIGRMIGASK